MVSEWAGQKEMKTQFSKTITESKKTEKLEQDQKNMATFNTSYPNAIKMLEEIDTRLPWRKNIVDSLMRWVKNKGSLSAKQLSLVTDMYLDNCAMSDSSIKEQVNCRKLCFRLLETRLGKVTSFIKSVTAQTDTRPFSQSQMRGVRKIADFKKKELSQVPELSGKNFDGWNKLPKSGLDN
jgi:hypothetical protein